MVVKFGGSSVSALKETGIVEAIKKIRQDYSDTKVICVLSAGQNETDTIKKAIHDLSPVNPSIKDHDILITMGENQSIGRVSLVANREGLTSTAVQAWQIPILTTSPHNGKAYIKRINAKVLKDYLASNEVLFIAGFQGIDKDNSITALGRGGSDITAVAIAAVLKLDEVFIVTDIDGIRICDPRLIDAMPDKIKELHYDEAVELAWLGTNIIHPRAVEIAKSNHLTINISSYNKPMSIGTKIGNYDTDTIGVSVSRDELLVTIKEFPNKPGNMILLLDMLFKENIDIDLLTQIPSDCNFVEVLFCVNTLDTQGTKSKFINQLSSHIGTLLDDSLNCTIRDVDKISIISNRMRDESNMAYKLYQLLNSNNVSYYLMGGPSNRLSVLIGKSEEKIGLTVNSIINEII